MANDYLRIEPPARKSDKLKTIYIAFNPLRQYENELELPEFMHFALHEGKPLNSEDLLQQRIAESEDPGTEEGREGKTQELHEEVTEGIVALMNFALLFTEEEISEDSTFQLIDAKDLPKKVKTPTHAIYFVAKIDRPENAEQKRRQQEAEMKDRRDFFMQGKDEKQKQWEAEQAMREKSIRDGNLHALLPDHDERDRNDGDF